MTRVFTSLLAALLLLTGIAQGATNFGSATVTEELQQQLGAGQSSYLWDGCQPAVPVSSLTMTSLTCKALVQDSSSPPRQIPVVQGTIALTLPAVDGTYWIALTIADLGSPGGSWSRESNKRTHFTYQLSASHPAEPSDGMIVAKVTVASSIISEVDLYGMRVITGPLTISASQDWYGLAVIQPRGKITVASGITLTLHTCPDASPGQQIFDADNVTTGLAVLNCDTIWVDWYGVMGDDATDGEVPLEGLCATFSTLKTSYPKPRHIRFRSGSTYRLGNVACQIPDGVPNTLFTVDLGSSMIKATEAGILFDFNPIGDCTTTPFYTNALRFFRLVGNSAVIDGDAITGALDVTAVKLYVTRDVRVSGIVFRDLKLGVQGCFQDNTLFQYNRFINVINGIVQLNDWPEDPSWNVSNAANGFTTSQFFQNTFNLTPDVAERAIHIEGATSALFQNNVYAGKGTDGVLCHVLLNNTHTIQTAQGTMFIREHHEALSNEGRYLCLNDTGGMGWDAPVVIGGHWEFPTACNDDCTAIVVNNATGLVIEGLAVSCSAGTNMVTVRLRNSTTNAVIGANDFDKDCTPVDWDGTMVREDFQRLPSTVLFATPVRTEEDSTGTTYFDRTVTLSDMSVTLDTSRTNNVGVLSPQVIPRRWLVRIVLTDSDWSIGTTGNYPRPSIILRTDATKSTVADAFACGVNGITNDDWLFCEGSVIPDANGDFLVVVDASGTNTMLAAIYLMGYEQ
jgi:mRNA-degrading endonuclease toxin of MazEF toxin-antitoxin module